MCYHIFVIKKFILFMAIFVLATGTSLAIENSSPSASVEYTMPHPGMLPDNKLYKLKVLRDKLMLFLIQDTSKKAEQHLLLADKRIQMASILADRGSMELAKETALKGENEITLLVNLFKDDREKPSKDFFEKVEKASMKHREILNKMVEKVEGEDKKTFETVIYFSNVNLEELRRVYKNY